MTGRVGVPAACGRVERQRPQVLLGDRHHVGGGTEPLGDGHGLHENEALVDGCEGALAAVETNAIGGAVPDEQLPNRLDLRRQRVHPRSELLVPALQVAGYEIDRAEALSRPEQLCLRRFERGEQREILIQGHIDPRQRLRDSQRGERQGDVPAGPHRGCHFVGVVDGGSVEGDRGLGYFAVQAPALQGDAGETVRDRTAELPREDEQPQRFLGAVCRPGVAPDPQLQCQVLLDRLQFGRLDEPQPLVFADVVGINAGHAAPVGGTEPVSHQPP